MTDGLQTSARQHHRLSVNRRVGPLALQVDLVFSAPWTLIFGPSGSGKSSLLRAACGLLGRTGIVFATRAADGGWESIAGPEGAIAIDHRGLAYAPQNPTLFPHLTVRENVAFAAASRGAGGGAAGGAAREHASLIEQAMEMFALNEFAARRPRELSGGERQRVNLARAFAVPEAKLMLLDEPFSGVDRAMRDSLLPRMQTWLRERSLPVISVSHDVDEALLLRAEVITLRQGAALAQGPALEVLREERLRLMHLLASGS